MQTFQDRLDDVGGFGPGFDLVRLLLCYEVMVWHTISLAGGDLLAWQASPLWLPFDLMVPMFFTLSGFLVTASALRLPATPYLLNRAARILPALFAVVGFATLVAGPLTTTLPIGDYFSDGRFWRHLTNLAGWPNYVLPGVFDANPYPGAVNGSLWTVRWEIGCYMMMAIMVGFGIARRPWAVPALALVWAAVPCILGPVTLWSSGLPAPIAAVLRQIFGTGGMLFPYFLGGATIWLYRRRIPWHGGVAALCGGMLLAAALLLDGRVSSSDPLKSLMLIAPSAYLVAWAGLQRLPVPRVYRGGDYSYGVYLWHFPVLQTLQHFLLLGEWWQLLLVGFLPVTLLAAASWHAIESPVLAARKRQTRRAAVAAA
ncbi:acyltransferase family protein [Sandarakinorhabdus sp.]|uniref:acyltransferase family protein n=1 Tax=Sandarakinorhabdus sp. TaxID=1916663 RepID=UPI003F6EC0BC